MSGAERAAKLRQIAELIDANAAELAELEALDGGGTIRKAQLADVPGAADAFEWFARSGREAARRDRPRGLAVPASRNYVQYEPIGVMHRHHPVELPADHGGVEDRPVDRGRQLLGAQAGVVHLDHRAEAWPRSSPRPTCRPASSTSSSGPGGTVGEELASNPLVDKTAFTGSTEVGRRIMQLASGTVKPVTLELGGKSANIVLDDADLDLAAGGVLWGTFMHGGQVCESGTRALVQRGIYDEFVSLLADRAGKIVLGDQIDMMTDLGPLVSRSQVETVERYVASSVATRWASPSSAAAKPDCLAEGLDPDAFFRPTIFADVDNKAKIAQEEIFGPVLSVIPFESDDEAVAIANDSIYGLAGGVQSGNLERAEGVAARMRTGTVWINDYHLIDPGRPFGGYKQSGIGRELGTLGYDDLPPGEARAHQPRDHRARQPLPLRGAQRI